MAITVKHSKVSTIPDDADTSLVRPSDWNDDHVLTGTVPVANGGTGGATANEALTNLLPGQTGNSGKFLSTDGTNTLWSVPAGSGDVVGPASSTDNAITRFDGTTGKLIQNSVVTIGDTGAATGFTTLSASTSVTTPIVQATNSGGLALKNSAGTTQMSMGAGGGDNMSINVSTNINGTNAQIDISPTGTGHVHIKPSGTNSVEIAPTSVGTIDNMTIGATTAVAGSFTNLSVTGTTSFDGAQGTAGQVLTSAGTGNTPTWTTPTVGDVVGPSSATDNAVARFDSTTGKLIQNSTVTIDDSGQLNLTNASNYNLYASGAGANYMEGSLGIGGFPLASTNIYNIKNITGAINSYGMATTATIQSDVTSVGAGYQANLSTVASAFTLSNLRGLWVAQGTIGVGSAVTNQIGVYVAAQSGATNNYAFQGLNASATGRYNLYMQGTANNYMAGSLGIGATSLANFNLRISKTLTGSTSAYGIRMDGVVQSDVTSGAVGISSNISTAAASFTTSFAYAYLAESSTLGAGSAIGQLYGFHAASSLTTATINYGFYGDIAAGTGRYNLYMNGTANNYLAGSLSIGTAPSAAIGLYMGKTITGAATAYAFAANGNIQSDVTSLAYGVYSGISTAAAAFTLTTLRQFAANGATIGAGSAVTTQAGFHVASTLTTATNDYGFQGDLAAATGVYNLYMGGTANNYLAGSLGIGTTSLTGINLFIAKNITGGTSSFGIAHSASVQSDVTSNAYGMNMSVSTAAASFTLTNLYLTRATFGGLGASSAITNMFGYYAESTITSATNNYGFYGAIAAGTGRYNLYMAGTAQNLFAGDVLIFSTGGLGYTTGSGGAITQATSRTTGVTLNKTNGAITLVSAAGSATYQSFTVTNSTVAATDTIIVNQKSGTDLYEVFITAVAAGSFRITYRTTGGTTTEQPVFNFAIIKAVVA
jgi:hypothetical protein